MPKHQKPDQKLSTHQKAVLVGSLLGDCWIELGNGRNGRVGFQQTVKSAPYFNSWLDIFHNWITQATYNTAKAVYGQESFPQLSVRTIRHPEFTEYYQVFRPGDGRTKVVPALSWLKANFTAVSLAHLFAQDGSRHGLSATAGFDLHTQGFGFEGSARLALFLYESFGIYAWPTRDVHNKIGKVYWNVYISSDSFGTVQGLIRDLMVQEMADAKFHPFGQPKSTINTKKKTAMFYSTFGKNEQLREDVSYSLPSSEIDAYAAELTRLQKSVREG